MSEQQFINFRHLEKLKFFIKMAHTNVKFVC